MIQTKDGEVQFDVTASGILSVRYRTVSSRRPSRRGFHGRLYLADSKMKAVTYLRNSIVIGVDQSDMTLVVQELGLQDVSTEFLQMLSLSRFIILPVREFYSKSKQEDKLHYVEWPKSKLKSVLSTKIAGASYTLVIACKPTDFSNDRGSLCHRCSHILFRGIGKYGCEFLDQTCLSHWAVTLQNNKDENSRIIEF